MKKFFFALCFLTALAFMPACDRCADVACKNGGTCVDGKCNCAYGYEGALCDKVTISNLAGSYSANDFCTDTFPSTAKSSSIVVRGTQLKFQPLELFINPVVANTDSADGKHIIILRQKPDGTNKSIEGDGQISFNDTKHAILSLSYTIVDSTVTPPTTTSCTPVLTHL